MRKGWSDWSCPSVVVVRLSKSACLLVQKTPVLQIQAVCYISAKYLQTVKNCLCPCFFLLDAIYKCLKSCVLSWYRGHAYRPHPNTWPPVQCDITVSLSLGFTIQRAFVRRWFVPILKEACASCVMSLMFGSLVPRLLPGQVPCSITRSLETRRAMKRRLSVTNLSSKNNLPMFRVDAPVIIRVKSY